MHREGTRGYYARVDSRAPRFGSQSMGFVGSEFGLCSWYIKHCTSEPEQSYAFGM